MKNILEKSVVILTIILCGAQAVDANSEKSSEVMVESLDYTVHFEMTINSPPKDVWPYVLDFATWHPGMKVEHIEGEPNKAGELREITYPNAEPFFMKVLNVIPFKHYSGKMNVGRNGTGPGTYGHFGLIDLGGKTLFAYDVYAHTPIPPTPQSQINDLREKHIKGYLSVIDIYLPQLKTLAENR